MPQHITAVFLKENKMTIEKITHFSRGVFAMLVFEGKPNEMTFESEAEAMAYVAAFNKMVAA